MNLEETIKQLPQGAGIYQYFDENGHLLYIGKAKSLAKRVKSYFNFTPELKPNSNLSGRITKMISETHAMNYIVVNSENDALILENSLIKQLSPKYNILLRDDKTYPYIYIDNSQEYPRFEITRKIIKSPNIKYYGPYSVGARDILDSIYEICRLVQKKGSLKSKKLCLYYQIGKCLGPCELKVSKEAYKKELDTAKELIQNKKTLIKKLEEKMLFYAQNLRFEEAGEIRDRCERIGRSEIKSEIDFASDENYDIFVVQNTPSRAVVVRIFMREGKIISSSHDYIQLHEGYDEDEVYQRVVMEFYSNGKPPIIAPILVASDFEGRDTIENYLTTLFEKKAHIKIPKTGNKKRLIDLALINALELLKKDKNQNSTEIFSEIQELFSLQKTPNRVEIFDNSHMSGVATVGAMAVYENGTFDKKSYRIYHLDARDEYSQMRETLTRRVESFSKNSPPDLWIIDGGSTLLNLALEILESNGIFLDVIAISKEKIDAKAHRAKGKAKDIIHTKDEIFKLQESDKRLHWVQKLRDEAHRCAIGFHKKTKLKLDQESKLLTLKGISQAKIIKLLKHFGTFDALKKSSVEEISSILNLKDANIIKNIYI
ncbi:MAG: excinuclease ABC subunit C [Sulfurimonas sp. RIFCSPHIGHO2_12_FULL_36_9]|uniref:excinuclease ABC subunit UvrC n=1 Tax=Sulfurimonas sp. RIFCSPLOWO2_12_36_12 TaxID=1802253 RepID=UPI0008D70F63|nr:excinuclease ABC subunit UvrC [Sulfurimonas sp. RIFCSPLOWO2_12_36_12]OHD97502.1 MAG: excinuclease ABC subunit C [Sulfurimonas sp. RIFCSPHIGHO2_12_FULL_36_9]OHE00142.1 MAG: excinuclease ABC subunit C [Sulfurimonas sp. RIFCSPLOWO2_02_FULL_36_28]OHE02964.1 MAG: excinuclease ABC subunit C [Sulfurimonas sp. RIFCSPLOWO2_12_36_12]OHE07896.1 MAG: excinuclease ABC subunit C [Sulfurimonas sp. RIFCSPLOWO2_12_FULL_36_74]